MSANTIAMCGSTEIIQLKHGVFGTWMMSAPITISKNSTGSLITTQDCMIFLKTTIQYYRSLFDVMGKHPLLWVFIQKHKFVQREEEKCMSLIRSRELRKVQQARRKYNREKEEVIRNLKTNYEHDNDHDIFLEELWKWQGAAHGAEGVGDEHEDGFDEMEVEGIVGEDGESDNDSSYAPSSTPSESD